MISLPDKGRHKNGPEGAFTRDRALPFSHLIISILRMGKNSLQREMDSFFKETLNEDFNIRKITKGGFSQARRKLNPEAFLELNDVISQDFYQEVEYLGYHGHRILAVDGSFLNLPRHKSIREEFGSRKIGRNADFEKNMCLLSLLYDPANYITLDVQCDHMDGSESELLLNHLSKVSKGDILILDRGYPSRFLFSLFQSKGIHFVCRMGSNWVPVKEFTESPKQDIEVVLEVSKNDFEKYKPCFPSLKKTVKCRLVKINLPDGTQEILCTSLLEKKKYTLEELGDMYHMRWGIEEGFKLFKSRVQIEAFSGKTAIAIKQDIYAKIMMMTLCAVLAFPIEQRVIKEHEEEKKKGTKHKQKINRTYAYWATKGMLIGLFIKKTIQKALSAFDREVAANKELDRPGRKNPRKKLHPRMYHMNYKDL